MITLHSSNVLRASMLAEHMQHGRSTSVAALASMQHDGCICMGDHMQHGLEPSKSWGCSRLHFCPLHDSADAVRQVRISFPDAVPIGVACAAQQGPSTLLLNPYDDYVIQPGEPGCSAGTGRVGHADVASLCEDAFPAL